MPDVTLANLNMLYVRYLDRVEREVHLPLGPLYLVRALEDAGFDVDFRDYQLCGSWDLFTDEAVAGFLAGSADVLFASCMANLLPFTLLALERFKREHPESVIVLGGVGPASVERQVLELCPWIDAIGIGEGERSAVALLRTIRRGKHAGRSAERPGRRLDLSAVPGVAWRDGERVVVNPPAARIEDLDSIPFPAWDRIDISRYGGINLLSSRGCPFPCTFCSVAPIWGRRPYLRSPRNVAAEMRRLHELRPDALLLFQDEYFVSSPERVLAVCREIEALGLPIRWKAFGRIDLTDIATMEAMARAGCVEIRYGVESGCDDVLERTRKGFTARRALEVLSAAVGIFPGVDAFYIWGFPFETPDQFQQTLLHMISARAMGVRILPSLLSLLPQTALYEGLDRSDPLEFCPELFPEYMLTGHEICGDGRMTVAPEHRTIYDFIVAHPGVFPGFFHVGIETNVLPKYRLLQKFGFYTLAGRTELLGADVECCGAHSPDQQRD